MKTISKHVMVASLPLLASLAGCSGTEGAQLPTEGPPATASPSPRPSVPATPEVGTATRLRAAARAVGANELGVIPVLMYHRIVAGGSEYDVTPKAFKAELARLFREGFRPVRMIDVIRGEIDLPAGTSPVVLTFDDSSPEQFAYNDKGKIEADSAIGILLSFARSHPGFEPVASFYVNERPFRSDRWEGMLQDLAGRGMELGNHTLSHADLSTLSDGGVRKELALGTRLIERAVEGVDVETIALPLGIRPDHERLLRKGAWRGMRYEHRGALLVGSGPSPSPFSEEFDPWGIPRIRSASQPEKGAPDYGSEFWLDHLKADPELRYVSDGEPEVVSLSRGTSKEN